MDTFIEVEIGPVPEPGRYLVRVLHSVGGGEPTATCALDVEGLLGQRTRLEETILASAVSARRVISTAETSVQAVGIQLFDAIFSGDIGAAYRTSTAVASERGAGVQLVLRLNSPGLAALPWEALYDNETRTYLCRKEPLVRLVAASRTAPPLPVQPPLQVLGVISSPKGLEALDVEAERDLLGEALREHVEQGRVALHWLVDATWEALHATLLEQPWHVLHFIGHGSYDVTSDEGVLALVGRDGRPDHVSASSLADLLHEATPTPRLVMLNSCKSGASGDDDPFSGTAAALANSGIHAVAAMQFTVSDQASIAFSRGFYTALAHGRSIDEAMRSGRIGILGMSRQTLEWVTPVLYVRGHNTHLFDVALPARSGGQAQPVEPAVEPVKRTEPVGVRAKRADTPTTAVRSSRGRAFAAVLVTLVVVAVAVFVFVANRPTPLVTDTFRRTVPGDVAMADTGVDCGAGDTLDITATGTINHDSSASSTVGPDGLTDVSKRQFNVPGLPGANAVALIGALDQGAPFLVGSRRTFICPRSGTLQLGINDRNVGTNSGAFAATILRTRATS